MIMKLNNKQSFAIIKILVRNKMIDPNYIDLYLVGLGELFDGEIKELRAITRYGAAGKLWNNSYGRIYVTGYSQNEADKFQIDYQQQQQEINEANRNIEQVIEFYKN